jgi:hypothetical protein
MLGMDLLIAPGEDKQTSEPGDAAGKEFDEVDRSRVSPMDVFEYKEGRAGQLVKPMEEIGKKPAAIIGSFLFPVVFPDLPDDIIKGGQGPGSEEGVADAEIDFGVMAMFLAKGPNQGGFADARFAAQHDAMAFPGRDFFIFVVQRRKLPGSFDQFDVHQCKFGKKSYTG